MKIYKLISNFYPKNLKDKYVGLIKSANIKTEPNRFIGFIFVMGLLLSISLGFFLARLFGFSFWISCLLSFIVFEVAVYMMVVLRADSIAKFVEKVLPDALHLMSSNLRAGLTVDKAIISSARPEFGILSEEINRVGKEITTGKSFSASLMKITERIRSERLEKTIKLIISGLKSGGELALLFEHSSRNLRGKEVTEEKIKGSVQIYIIFIFIAICFGAPLLFGLSSFLVDLLGDLFGSIELPETGTMNLPLNFSAVPIGTDFVVAFSLTYLVFTSIFGSLTMGLISRGKEKYGFKFIPFLLIISIGLYFLIRHAIGNLIGGFITF